MPDRENDLGRHLNFHALEERRAIAPLTDTLQAVHQVGKGLGEVGAHGKGAAVAGDGRILTSCIFVAGRQVCMRLC